MNRTLTIVFAILCFFFNAMNGSAAVQTLTFDVEGMG